MNHHQGSIITLQCYKVYEDFIEQTCNLISNFTILPYDLKTKIVKNSKSMFGKAVLKDNFHLEKCNNSPGLCTQHFIFVFSMSLENMVIQLFLARLDQLQYHFSCGGEICLENSVLKMHFLVEAWSGVYAGGTCVF